MGQSTTWLKDKTPQKVIHTNLCWRDGRNNHPLAEVIHLSSPDSLLSGSQEALMGAHGFLNSDLER